MHLVPLPGTEVPVSPTMKVAVCLDIAHDALPPYTIDWAVFDLEDALVKGLFTTRTGALTWAQRQTH